MSVAVVQWWMQIEEMIRIMDTLYTAEGVSTIADLPPSTV